MSSPLESRDFQVPERKVLEQSDISLWLESEAHQNIVGFLTAMNDAVKGKKGSSPCHRSEATEKLLKVFEIMHVWIEEIPPIEQPQRFGNKAFRSFYGRLKENASKLLEEHMEERFHVALIELAPYFIESFGNSTRIDYGTGHELAFIMFLCGLFEIGLLTKADSVATVNLIFRSYLDLARKLQIVYKMEPAGSQGVWSLDDYQFIPFYWGSSQLLANPKISPEMITDQQIVEQNHEEYLFLSCIKYILQVKTGPFAEHSNQLWNISGVKTWTKVNQGLMKMYKAEILNKFPVIQHVLFGSIFTLKKAEPMKPPSLFLPAKGLGGILPPGRPLGSFGSSNKPVAVVSPSVVQPKPPSQDESSANPQESQ